MPYKYSKTGCVFTLKLTVTEGRPVQLARAWCGTLGAKFYRLNPPITKVNLNESDNRKLIQMMWETQCFIFHRKDSIKKVADLLKRTKPQPNKEMSVF